jgi:mono/diheme cytochrome c family protein
MKKNPNLNIFSKIRCGLLMLLCLVILSGTWGCGQEKDSPETPPATPPPMPPPATSAPPAVTAPVTAETRETYQFYCAQCHGVKGKGNGINAKYLTVPPRDHTKADYLETRSDEQLFTAIQKGGLFMGRAPCMPAWGNTLSEETIHSLVRYIRELCQCEGLL